VLPISEAEAWRSFLEGEGHVFSGTTSASSKGLTPSSATGWSFNDTGAYGGTGGFLSTGAGTISWPTALSGAWTFLVQINLSGTWVHYISCSDGRKWADGVRNDALSTFDTAIGVSSGSMFATAALAGLRMDDLVLLPFSIPTDWAPSLFTFHDAQAFAPLPRITAGGDVYGGTATAVLGEAEAGNFIDYTSAGVAAVGESFGFVLRGV
jgi:hypothetical protein